MRPIVLIIDDDLVSQYATRYVVSQSENNALIYVNDSAEEALNRLTQLKSKSADFPDIILLDLVMPGIGGWGFIEKFQKIKGIPKKTKIYVLSSFTSSKDRNKAKNNSIISGFFDKPISRNMVDSIFANRHP